MNRNLQFLSKINYEPIIKKLLTNDNKLINV